MTHMLKYSMAFKFSTILSFPSCGTYEINLYGDVRKIGSKRLLKRQRTKSGWEFYFLNESKTYLHNLMADTFLAPLHEHNYIQHVDGNRSNNKLGNLRRVTYDEMMKISAN